MCYAMRKAQEWGGLCRLCCSFVPPSHVPCGAWELGGGEPSVKGGSKGWGAHCVVSSVDGAPPLPVLALAGLGFALAKRVLYRLSHTSSPFCSGYFGTLPNLTQPPKQLRS
jgi:hypothetical protein